MSTDHAADAAMRRSASNRALSEIWGSDFTVDTHIDEVRYDPCTKADDSSYDWSSDDEPRGAAVESDVEWSDPELDPIDEPMAQPAQRETRPIVSDVQLVQKSAEPNVLRVSSRPPAVEMVSKHQNNLDMMVPLGIARFKKARRISDTGKSKVLCLRDEDIKEIEETEAVESEGCHEVKYRMRREELCESTAERKTERVRYSAAVATACDAHSRYLAESPRRASRATHGER